MELLGDVLAWVGPLLIAAAWLMVRRGLASIWVAMGLTTGPLGLLALLSGIRAAEDVAVGAAAAIGLGAGAALYGATAAFMYLFRRWPVLVAQASRVYEWRRGLPLWATALVASLAVAPGEEALWRGVVQERLSGHLGEVGGAGAVWAAYVAVNAVAGSLPILLAAAVGGAAWGALALLTGGVVASVCCHVVWTGLMVLLPPVFSPGRPR